MASMPQVAPVGRPLTVIPGQVPRPGEFPSGCRFHPRCSYAVEACRTSPVASRGRDPVHPRRTSFTSRERCGRRRSSHRPSRPPRSPDPAPLLEVRDLAVSFPVHSGVLRRVVGRVRAVDGVSFSIPKGQTLGLVGESGSGKSTTARLVLRLDRAHVRHASSSTGVDVTALGKPELRRTRRRMQIVFQDPYSSLDPRSTVGETDRRATRGPRGSEAGKARDEKVGRAPRGGRASTRALRSRYPHEFSGGQRQRIAVARALALSTRPPHLRRAGQLPRRVDAVPGHQPARRATAAARADLPLHRP